ncbi:MAG: thioesterase family protein [Acidimicrobiia bacterium]|nr:thioesterase family protein [Acidimicrobiia bacterium]
MGDFGHDTTVTGSDGHYRASVSQDWEIWGPMGGYVAAVGLRAAAAEVPDGHEPATLTCQFLAAAKFEPVDIEVRVRRQSRRATAVAVHITQDERPVLDAQAWFATPSNVVQYDHTTVHRHGHPDDHPPISAYTSEPSRFRFWENFEGKPLNWIEDLESYLGGEPEWAEWLRFVPTATFDEPILEAARVLLLADLPSYPAAVRAFPRTEAPFISPSLDLAVQFHRLSEAGEWLLVQGVTPIAERGLLGFRSEVWNAAGQLLATGSGQLLGRSVLPS